MAHAGRAPRHRTLGPCCIAANTAANLTANRLATTISGLGDLPGKSVGTYRCGRAAAASAGALLAGLPAALPTPFPPLPSHSNYVDRLKRRNIDALAYPWDDIEDEREMIAAVKVRGGRGGAAGACLQCVCALEPAPA